MGMKMMSETEHKPEQIEQQGDMPTSTETTPTNPPVNAAEVSGEPPVTETPEATEAQTANTGAESTIDDAQSQSQQVTELIGQRDAFQSQYMRIAADFDNFRKRTGKEKEELETRIKSTTITELLGVVDNFERARTQIKPGNEGEMAIHKSYQGVYKQLVDSLKKLGVSPMRPEGQQFDPNLHEAVMRQPTDEHPEGTVIEELQRGYFIDDRILRHALVKVAAPGEGIISASDADAPLPSLEES
jgi:molecular chaperone GrpE